MDILTHIFLPIAILIVFRKEFMEKPIYILILIGFLGILPDIDKFLGIPGFLHSFITLSVIVLMIFCIEYSWKKTYLFTIIAAFLLYSHLFLDILDSSPVALFYPLINTTVSLQFESVIDFNHLNILVIDPPVKVVYGQVHFSFKSYKEYLTGYGVLSLIIFILIYMGMKRNKYQ